MRAKQIQAIQIILATLELSVRLAGAGEIEERLKQSNPDFHITSEAFSNAPYWLMPTNVPYRLFPLENGQWIWTTNMMASWRGGIGIEDAGDAKIINVRQQEMQRMDETDPLGIAHVGEYSRRGWNEKHMWNTNMVKNWQGITAEYTNTGWRVNVMLMRSNLAYRQAYIRVGSIVTNSGVGLLPTPDGKYAKLELFDANGKAIPARRGAAMALYRNIIPGLLSAESQVANTHPPSTIDSSVEENYPATISDLEYARWKNGSFPYFAGFVSNGPPCQIGYMEFNDIFSIKSEGDYTFVVQPVLFRMHYDGGTFQGYLDRVDLPCVRTKVHLTPMR